MAHARTVNLLVVRMPTRVGLLADVAAALSEAGVNIKAISAYEREGEGTFLLVPDDVAKASTALARLNATVTEKTALSVELEDRPGALEEVARKVAEAGINIDYVFGTTGGGATATVIMKSDDDHKLANLL